MKTENIIALAAVGAAAFGAWYYFFKGKETLAGAPGQGGALGAPLFELTHPGAVEAPNLMGGGAGYITPAPVQETVRYWLDDIAQNVGKAVSSFVPETPLETQQKAAAFVAGQQAKAAALPSPVAGIIRVPAAVSQPAVAYISQPVGIIAKIPSTVPGFQTGGGMLGVMRGFK